MNHATRVYDTIFEMLPSEENPSPLVALHRMNPAEASGYRLYAKLEWMNPFGSVKDRAAWAMIRDLEDRGEIGPGRPGRGLVEPTSGNTGISLAAMARARGYPMRAVVPAKIPDEKKVLLKAVGADLDVVNDTMCPSPGMGEGSIGIARSYARAQGDTYVMANQYENPQNVLAHMRTTGPEIWRQTEGKVSHVFTSLGTCGTVTGLAMFLKENNPAIRVVAVQPTEGHDIPGIRNVSELHVTKLFDPSLIDEIIEIDYNLAYTRALELSRTEGLLAGPSSGLIYEGARRVLERDQPGVGGDGGVGVMIFCDNLFKYASSLVKHDPSLAATD